MFRSALESFGSELLTVVLTGMGSDGKAGTGAIVEAGGTAIVQDEETSVVWGMPGATATAGFAHRILPLDEIGPSIWTILSASRAVPGAAGVGGTGGAGSSGPLSGTTRTGIGTAGDKTTKIRGLR
jgi:two-component system chemotaxis response regulator CheB